MTHLLMHVLKFPLAEDVDAAFLPPGQNQPVSQFIAVFGRKNNAPLFVKTRRVRPEEHTHRLPVFKELHPPRHPQSPLQSPTLLHNAPLSTTHGSFPTNRANSFPCNHWEAGVWGRVEGFWSKTARWMTIRVQICGIIRFLLAPELWWGKVEEPGGEKWRVFGRHLEQYRTPGMWGSPRCPGRRSPGTKKSAGHHGPRSAVSVAASSGLVARPDDELVSFSVRPDGGLPIWIQGQP